MLQLPWPPLVEHRILILADRDILPLTFASLALGLLPVVIAVDQSSTQIASFGAIDGIQCLSNSDISADFMRPLFARRNFHCCFLSLITGEDYIRHMVEDLSKAVVISLHLTRVGPPPRVPLEGASFDSGSFGYVKETIFCRWQSNVTAKPKLPALPSGITVTPSGMTGYWCGAKPLPPKPRLESNAGLPFIPTSVVIRQGEGGLLPDCILSRRSQVKSGTSHRALLDSELLFLLGYPRSLNLRDPSLPEAEGARDALPRVAKLPNAYAVAFFLWLALMTFKAESLSTRWAYCPDEETLRNQVRGTCWDPTIGPNFPGLITRTSLVAEMKFIFSAERYRLVEWDIPIDNSDLAALQTYWVYTQLKGMVPHSQGPSWSAQRFKAKAMATLGSQRATSDSSRGLDHIFPPGLGKESHLEHALRLPSPYETAAEHDKDLSFAMTAAGVWGPYLEKWRLKQMSSMRKLRRALRRVNAKLVESMDPYVAAVAAERHPAGIAAMVTLLRWPDRKLPTCFTEGFPIIGEVEESGIFRRLRDSREPADLNSEFFGDSAKKFIKDLEKTRSSPQVSRKLDAKMRSEFSKGRFFHNMSREDADKFFGKGKWRPMPLFIIEQASKDRLISDAKKGGHNAVVSELETIFVPSVDFIPECLLGLSREIRQSPWLASETTWLPDWAQPVMGTEDLDEAYGQCPAMPSQRGACVVGWYSTEHDEWRYAEAKGLVFGLSAAVVGFNRWPALMTATFRRTMAGMGVNYFDDFCPISMLCDAVSSRDALSLCADINGGSFGTAKSIPPGTQRAFVGVYANLDRAAVDGETTFFPREDCIASIREMALEILKGKPCTPGTAAKLRGKAGWASTNLFARMGRVGLAALKARQYYQGDSYEMTPRLKEALIFLTHLGSIPPRAISIRGDIRKPLLVYSDASWPSKFDGEKEAIIPRIGWVIFDPLNPSAPKGFSLIVNESITSRLIEREQQILAVEAFAAAAAPWISPEIFSDRDSVWFVDNAAAVSTLIRGAAKPEDIDRIATTVAFQNASLRHRPWFEWIDSDSNPSDGLSRLGVEDPWTRSQNWILQDLSSMDWGALFDTFTLDVLLAD